MIKLQLVLHPASRTPTDEPAVIAKLAAIGIHATGYGLATVSAEIAEEKFSRLWGKPPAQVAGFATGLDVQALVVPAALTGVITSISTVPRHTVFGRP